ncbi:hypothetical protein D3C80_1626090 [compost metagenome]
MILIIFDLDVIWGSGFQQYTSLPAVAALLLPAVDNQPAADPDADSVIRGGYKGISFAVQRLNGSGPADGKKIFLDSDRRRILMPVKVDLTVIADQIRTAGKVNIIEILCP